METPKKKKNDDNGIGWLTRPFYNIMLLSLVVLFTMKESRSENYNDIFHILMFLSFGVIIILNVWNVFSFFKNFKNPKLENKEGTEEE